MNISQLLKEKKLNSDLIKQDYKLLKSNKAVWLILLSDTSVLNSLLLWCKSLPIDFVVISESNLELVTNNIAFTQNNKINSWFDFIVTDNEISWLDNYLKNWIVPILPEKNHMRSILKEFNPMKNEGNSYFYYNNDAWSIFYSIVRYLENYKFSFDNKNLVKNVLDI